MALPQIATALPPFNRPAIGMRAARLLGLAEAMGLLAETAAIGQLDWSALGDPIRTIVSEGIGRDAALELGQLEGTDDPERLAEVLDRLHSELELSPNPGTETSALTRRLGLELLAVLVHTSTTSVRRYTAKERTTPDAVAARLHHLARIVAALAGGYNDFGIRRWFMRRRPQLEGRAPTDVLAGDWDPDEDGPQRVLILAQALNSSPAT
ncbi:MAG: hypothetical protein ACRDQZ_04770 [Mycobacteriales bacterium]